MAQGDSNYDIVEKGTLHTLDYRIYIKGPTGYVSPWHDIPLYADEPNKIFNMVVEIPRWTNAKMEMSTTEALTPIKQDVKKGVPRFVHNVFPHKGYIWNYGALPQTWEDPNHKDDNTSAQGDNDPIDVLEIGNQVQPRGAVIRVKVLGLIALLDEGETDWKLITISVKDPLASSMSDIGDVEKHMPGLLSATYEWLRVYKIPAGKPANKFGFDGEFKGRDFAYTIIDQTHDFWKALIKDKEPKLNTESHYKDAAHPVDDATRVAQIDALPVAGPAQPIPSEVDYWHFINASAKL